MRRTQFIQYGGMLLGLVIFALYGCAPLIAGGVAGGATYVYTEGWVARDYNVGIDQAYKAGLQAADNLEMTVVKKEKDMSSANIKLKKGDEDYWIKMEEKAKKRTTISVRTGVVGDKESSQKIHEEIKKQV